MKIIRLSQSDIQVSESTSTVKMWSDEEMDDVDVQRKEIRMSDSLGGSSFITVRENERPQIIDIRSAEHVLTGEYDQHLKRRGFFAKVIDKLKELGYAEFGVSLQSSDSRGALGRLVQKGVISPIPGYQRGVSTDLHPTAFRIL